MLARGNAIETSSRGAVDVHATPVDPRPADPQERVARSHSVVGREKEDPWVSTVWDWQLEIASRIRLRLLVLAVVRLRRRPALDLDRPVDRERVLLQLEGRRAQQLMRWADRRLRRGRRGRETEGQGVREPTIQMEGVHQKERSLKEVVRQSNTACADGPSLRWKLCSAPHFNPTGLTSPSIHPFSDTQSTSGRTLHRRGCWVRRRPA